MSSKNGPVNEKASNKDFWGEKGGTDTMGKRIGGGTGTSNTANLKKKNHRPGAGK